MILFYIDHNLLNGFNVFTEPRAFFPHTTIQVFLQPEHSPTKPKFKDFALCFSNPEAMPAFASLWLPLQADFSLAFH